MPRYVDGFVIPIAKKKLPEYRALAKASCKIWLEHGALQYVETVAEDMNLGMGLPFPTLCRLKRTETVVFAWVTYKSRAHRDRVNKKIMTDPRMQAMMAAMDPKKPIFDMARFSYGGFEVLVEG